LRLKINFTDFWKGFNKTSNYFWDLLSTRYELEISEEPELLIFSVYGNDFKKYKCLRIIYIAECYEPNLNICDLAFSFSYNPDVRNYRLPLYILYYDIKNLLNKPPAEIIAASKTKFCCAVVSNNSFERRNSFFLELSKYKKVDSGGRYLNNIGGPVEDKIEFIKDYKFVISFENQSAPGYLTEKIMEPMRVNSIPIYFGDPLASRDFNSKSFINIHDFETDKKAIEYIIEVDKNDDSYREYLKQPWLPNNEINPNYLPENVLKRMELLIEDRHNIKLAASNKQYIWDRFKDKIDRKKRGERVFFNDSMLFKIRQAIKKYYKNVRINNNV
jgi:alpha(1,3/1,4) fucosyltransferase